MMFSECVNETSDGVMLTLHVQPRAASTEFAGLHGDTAVKLRVQAPPAEGAANNAVCRFLARHFGLPKQAVMIVSGAASRHKRVLLKGLSVDQVKRGLARET